jgi:hypothetical protein
VLVVGAACAALEAPTPTSTPTERPTPTSTPTSDGAPEQFHPLTQQTGLPGVDEALRTIATRDLNGFVARMEMVEFPCVSAESTPHGPVCPPGVVPGTVMRFFAWGSCEPVWLTTDGELRGAAAHLFRRELELYAVYRRTDPDSERFSVGEAYRILLLDLATEDAPQVFVTSDGKIRGILTGCGRPEESMPLDAEFVFPPRSTP